MNAIRLVAALFALAAVAVVPGRAAESSHTQSFTLEPGWNAIHLEVAPNDPSPEIVFGALANVEQVWAYYPTRKPVQYLSDPAAGLFNVPGWRGYFPVGSRPDAAALSTLKAVTIHQSYLVKYGGSAPTTLTVTGTTTYRGIPWQPDGFTLTGLQLDAAGLPSGDYFFNSPAHKGQARFRLDPSGTWIPLTDSYALRPGWAYWIFTKGTSDLSAPLELTFDGVRKLDFGPDQDAKTLTLRNRSAYPTTVSVSNPGNLPLATATLNTNPASGTTPALTWTPLTTLSQSIPAGGTATIKLGARRKLLAADAAALLQVSGGGVSFRLPVSISLPVDAATLGIPSRPGGQGEAAATVNPLAGLWIGNVTLNAVSEAHSETPALPTATPATFSLRLLVHVDAAGGARLLKDVTMMRRRAPEGSSEAQPFVLVTDPARLTDFAAPLQRDGSPFSYRVSSAGYDFSGTSVALPGTFGSSLTGTVNVGRTLPTNPFLHRYHPDHDDLSPLYAPLGNDLPPDQQEVWAVSRALSLTFDPPASDAGPASGYTERSGTYQETITGLHRNAVIVRGTFALRRVNPITEINPAP